jgi:DNA-binding transcriptional LysR family regulator
MTSMNAPYFTGFDLNLLRVFVALLDERSGTQAGRRLGLSQSAVSHSLNRLRYLLGDKLFVRSAAGMTPTQRALEIAPRVRQGLAQIEAALSPNLFVPAETTRRFTITAGAYAATVLLPGLIERLREAAPRAELAVRPFAPGLAADLDMGRTDIALGVFGRVPDRFAAQPLFSDRLVWVVRKGHPAADLPLTLDRLGALGHIFVAIADEPDIVQGSVIEQGLERRVVVDDTVTTAELAARGLARKVVLTVSDIYSALAVAARSDLITAAPLGIVRAFSHALGLKVLDPPYPAETYQVQAIWRRDSDGPALQWLRAALQEVGGRFDAEAEAHPESSA